MWFTSKTINVIHLTRRGTRNNRQIWMRLPVALWRSAIYLDYHLNLKLITFKNIGISPRDTITKSPTRI
jgi:hypothetical protein